MQADEGVNFQTEKEPVKGKAILVKESPGIQKEVRRSEKAKRDEGDDWQEKGRMAAGEKEEGGGGGTMV